MTFKKLHQLIFRKLPILIKEHSGLAVFARERAKFEGWLKVELCNIFANEERGYENTFPEMDHIDVVFQDWAIELKTINTSYRHEGAINKTCPTTKNVKDVIDDIIALRNNSSLRNKKKAVVFVVFPMSSSTPQWTIQLDRIRSEIRGDLANHLITFKNELPGVIYVGEV